MHMTMSHFDHESAGWRRCPKRMTASRISVPWVSELPSVRRKKTTAPICDPFGNAPGTSRERERDGRREREMDRKDNRAGAGGSGGTNVGNLARARLLTNRVPIGISSELCSVSHPEVEESPDALDVTPKYELSPWTRSGAKRVMDVGMVLASAPILIPVLAAIALAVLVTSGAPIFFLQERLGPHGVPFVIYKFRTMRPALVRPSSAIAIDSADRVTWLGAFLRRTKLDELPQIFHVLRGEMSLVGPRPKVPEQEPEPFPCRPGLTGAATLAFAREEMILQGIASSGLDEYFQTTVLAAKRALDADYLGRATMWSDLWILVNTVLGRWETYDRGCRRHRDTATNAEAADSCVPGHHRGAATSALIAFRHGELPTGNGSVDA